MGNNQTLNWDNALDLSQPWYLIHTGDERSVDSFVHYTSSQVKPVARLIRGKRCTTKGRLFQEWAAALQFPYYFGENWDAFNECIQDLEWLPADGYVFFITQADRVLSDSDKDLTILISILREASDYWRRNEENEALGAHPPTPFRVIFQIEAENEEFVNRLRRADAEPDHESHA